MEIVDKEAALMRIGGDEELYDEIVQIFLEDAPTQLNDLRKAFDDRDVAAAGRHAHSLKSAAANIGAERMREAAAKMEMTSREGDLERSESLIFSLEEEFALVKEFLAS